MSFLLGDDYASSSSESESDGEESVMQQTTRKEANSDENSLMQLLPSADSVLSSVAASTASFLPPKTSAKLQSPVKSFDLIAEQETQRQKKEKEQREQQPEVQRVVKTSRNDRKRPMQETASKEPSMKREKKDAKELVKSQRRKGQSGIGSDFRGWKPETAMKLRQQFD